MSVRLIEGWAEVRVLSLFLVFSGKRNMIMMREYVSMSHFFKPLPSRQELADLLIVDPEVRNGD